MVPPRRQPPPPPAPAEPLSATNVVRSAARGVPIVGGLADKLEAATEAALAPAVEPFLTPSSDSLMPAGDYSARYAKALELQRQKDTGFDVAHPVASTAAKIAGGIGSFGGAIKAVPALAAPLGLEGTIPQMVAKGATSGAAISAADALARGENPVTGAEEGAVLGAAWRSYRSRYREGRRCRYARDSWRSAAQASGYHPGGWRRRASAKHGSGRGGADRNRSPRRCRHSGAAGRARWRSSGRGCA